MTLQVRHAYYLEGMRPDMWFVPHKEFGRPNQLATLYLGCLCGTVRTWHLFEVWKDGRERGVIMMSSEDLDQLTVTEIT